MRKGAALPSVLLVMAMTSALAVGGVYVARSLSSATRLSQKGAALQSPAELSLIEAVAGWDSTARAGQPIGVVVMLDSAQLNGVTLAIWITRLGQTAYWLVAESVVDGRPLLRRRLGLLLTAVEGRPGLAPQVAWAELP